jgi:hypothetical protein
MSDVILRRLDALRDRYLVEAEIGHGGMATVYRARAPKSIRSTTSPASASPF